MVNMSLFADRHKIQAEGGDDLRASNKNWVYTVRHRLAALPAMRDALFHILYFLSRLKGT